MSDIGTPSQAIDSPPSDEAGAQAISFVIRIWKEPSPAGPEYRGWIEHVQSGRRAFFLGLDRLPELIATHVGPHTRGNTRWQQRLLRWRKQVAGWFGRDEEAQE